MGQTSTGTAALYNHLTTPLYSHYFTLGAKPSRFASGILYGTLIRDDWLGLCIPTREFDVARLRRMGLQARTALFASQVLSHQGDTSIFTRPTRGMAGSHFPAPWCNSTIVLSSVEPRGQARIAGEGVLQQGSALQTGNESARWPSRFKTATQPPKAQTAARTFCSGHLQGSGMLDKL